MIRLEDVSKSFGAHAVLEEISCTMERRRTTVIMGPSGVGKSVLSRIVVGLERPDRGRVLIDGTDVTGLSQRELFQFRRRIGMCFQDGALFNSMSVGENIAFPLRRHTRFSEQEVRYRVGKRLAEVGLPGLENRWPDELSGGMRKRVGIARALALEPEILIFDEPTSGLDPIMADTIDRLILDMKPSHTILIISHDLTTTLATADFIGMIGDRKLVQFGPAAEVSQSEDPIVSRFFSRGKRPGAPQVFTP